MPIRQPVVAGRFYPADRAGCLQAIEECIATRLPEDLPERILAGIVPHAGWAFSGPTAAKVYAAVQSQSSPDTFVLLSAVHVGGLGRAALFGTGAWVTPLGEVPVDHELAQQVLKEGQGLIVDAPEAHTGEHSVEVQVPFIQHLFPHADILPVTVPPDGRAVQTGEAIAQAVTECEKDVLVVGTTDLTHYGASFYGFAPAGSGPQALEWVHANDERVIELMLRLAAEEVVPEATTSRSACGAGAVAATIAAARALGARQGVLLEYTTSHHVMPRGPATDFVGYAAVVMGH